jgi:hypothetical protein
MFSDNDVLSFAESNHFLCFLTPRSISCFCTEKKGYERSTDDILDHRCMFCWMACEQMRNMFHLKFAYVLSYKKIHVGFWLTQHLQQLDVRIRLIPNILQLLMENAKQYAHHV